MTSPEPRKRPQRLSRNRPSIGGAHRYRRPFGDDDDPIGGAALFFMAVGYTMSMMFVGPTEGRGGFAIFSAVFALVFAGWSMAPQQLANPLVRRFAPPLAVVGSACVIVAALWVGLPADKSRWLILVSLWTHGVVGLGVPTLYFAHTRHVAPGTERDHNASDPQPTIQSHEPATPHREDNLDPEPESDVDAESEDRLDDEILPRVGDFDPADIAALIEACVPDLTWMNANRELINCEVSLGRATGTTPFWLLVMAPPLIWIFVHTLLVQRFGADAASAVAAATMLAVASFILAHRRTRRTSPVGNADAAVLSCGVVMQANTNLLAPGSDSAWAAVLTTTDPHLLANIDGLSEIAEHINQRRSTDDILAYGDSLLEGAEPINSRRSAEDDAVADWLANQNVYDARGQVRAGIQIPESLSGNKQTWLMQVLIHRHDIPGGVLDGATAVLPLFVFSREPLRGAELFDKAGNALAFGMDAENPPPSEVRVVPPPFWNGQMYTAAPHAAHAGMIILGND